MTYKFIATIIFALTLLGCQSTPKTSPIPTKSIHAPIKFSISGKIGITSITNDGNQSGTAFYAWSQDGKRFAIDLTGALGIGATSISFDGSHAILTSERTGKISAPTPEALLLRATGWQAPISQLPFWIMGRTAPSDSAHSYDDLGRLVQATNGAWTANFEYKNSLPNRLKITHTDGHRVVMTMAHTQ